VSDFHLRMVFASLGREGGSFCVSGIDIRNAEQLLAMDILVLVTMKNAAKCDT
jgi:hypothetical protein